ncbi:MAG TPA: cysteine hydrolase family protein [Blastocatellia bacterium]
MMDKNSVLLVIDLQVGIVDGLPLHNNGQLLATVNSLLSKARAAGVEVIYVQHDGEKGHPVETESPGWAIHPVIAPAPNELVVRKRASDSFFETRLHEILQERAVKRLVIAGAMTQYCIDTACRRAVSLGYDVILASDAHGTSDTKSLKAQQIIDHHNHLLNGFDAGMCQVRVRPSGEIAF